MFFSGRVCAPAGRPPFYLAGRQPPASRLQKPGRSRPPAATKNPGRCRPPAANNPAAAASQPPAGNFEKKKVFFSDLLLQQFQPARVRSTAGILAGSFHLSGKPTYETLVLVWLTVSFLFYWGKSKEIIGGIPKKLLILFSLKSFSCFQTEYFFGRVNAPLLFFNDHFSTRVVES